MTDPFNPPQFVNSKPLPGSKKRKPSSVPKLSEMTTQEKEAERHVRDVAKKIEEAYRKFKRIPAMNLSRDRYDPKADFRKAAVLFLRMNGPADVDEDARLLASLKNKKIPPHLSVEAFFEAVSTGIFPSNLFPVNLSSRRAEEQFAAALSVVQEYSGVSHAKISDRLNYALSTVVRKHGMNTSREHYVEAALDCGNDFDPVTRLLLSEGDDKVVRYFREDIRRQLLCQPELFWLLKDRGWSELKLKAIVNI